MGISALSIPSKACDCGKYRADEPCVPEGCDRPAVLVESLTLMSGKPKNMAPVTADKAEKSEAASAPRQKEVKPPMSALEKMVLRRAQERAREEQERKNPLDAENETKSHGRRR